MSKCKNTEMVNRYNKEDFTFVICAYKESPYLEECILSLINQKIKTGIIMVTSTPNTYIQKLANKYNLPYYINTGKAGIAEDWNFGYEMASGKIITIAHQDDIYQEEYASTVLSNINKSKHPLIAFTDYGEIRGDNRVTNNKLLNIKRIMLFPLKCRQLQNSIFVRRRILAFGSAICCPSVAFVKDNLPKQIFTPKYRSDVDWQAWERLSKLKGTFVYNDKILMYHRIHEESATTAIIADNDRSKEDYEMFCKFWPKWIANIIEHFYKQGEKSNEI